VHARRGYNPQPERRIAICVVAKCLLIAFSNPLFFFRIRV
jgi:hypothetical protein